MRIVITNPTEKFSNGLILIKQLIYDPLNWLIDHFQADVESKAYDACSFLLNGNQIIYRKAKITPTKTGQFVTLWKRKPTEPIQPFDELDDFAFVVIEVNSKAYYGQFIFPKSTLIKHGIISTKLKEGKRAIRVYPPWDLATNAQAQKTQKWQLNYFFNMDLQLPIQLNKIKKLYTCLPNHIM